MFDPFDVVSTTGIQRRVLFLVFLVRDYRHAIFCFKTTYFEKYFVKTSVVKEEPAIHVQNSVCCIISAKEVVALLSVAFMSLNIILFTFNEC